MKRSAPAFTQAAACAVGDEAVAEVATARNPRCVDFTAKQKTLLTKTGSRAWSRLHRLAAAIGVNGRSHTLGPWEVRSPNFSNTSASRSEVLALRRRTGTSTRRTSEQASEEASEEARVSLQGQCQEQRRVSVCTGPVRSVDLRATPRDGVFATFLKCWTGDKK